LVKYQKKVLIEKFIIEVFSLFYKDHEIHLYDIFYEKILIYNSVIEKIDDKMIQLKYVFRNKNLHHFILKSILIYILFLN
jgi:hypothetical protein